MNRLINFKKWTIMRVTGYTVYSIHVSRPCRMERIWASMVRTASTRGHCSRSSVEVCRSWWRKVVPGGRGFRALTSSHAGTPPSTTSLSLVRTRTSQRHIHHTALCFSLLIRFTTVHNVCAVKAQYTPPTPTRLKLLSRVESRRRRAMYWICNYSVELCRAVCIN